MIYFDIIWLFFYYFVMYYCCLLNIQLQNIIYGMLIKDIRSYRWYYLLCLIRFFNPIGFFLLLWPTLWALWLAVGHAPDFYVLIIFILGVFLMRSLGCIINDYVDRDIDSHIERTKNRPFSCGVVNIREVQILCLILLVLSICLLLILDCKIKTLILSLVALVLLCIYPYTKRYLFCPQIFLGLTFGFSILIVFSIFNISLCHSIPWLLFFGNLMWTMMYDTEYAMVDRKDDLCFGIKSSAIYFGKYDRLFIGLLQVVVLFTFSIIGWVMDFGIVFYSALVGVAMLFIWQQILIIDRDKNGCYQAFLNNNYVGMLIFIGIMCDHLPFME